ncbi:MAG: hypothetical protein ACI9HK_005751 [Pirellulaceae bacterium]|jgi:hypothetical protein
MSRSDCIRPTLCARSNRASILSFAKLSFAVVSIAAFSVATAEEPRSHPPLRPLPQASDRAMGPGPAFYVIGEQGSDENDGASASPWKSVAHALGQISGGDTLYLRGGTYYEHVYCSVAGTADQPITIRAYPGELAIIDGGIREFFESPETAWEPYAAGSAGEYRSKGTFKNLRNIHGRFGDSMVGLQVYYHSEDLRGERYVGPGIWYNRVSGHIHARLAHYATEGLVRARTPLTLKYLPHRLHTLESYRGETDPRKLPLIIAAFNSIPLLVDRAQHVRFEDLVIRGGGYDAVDLRHGEHIAFDNVTIYAAAYGLRARNTGPLKLHNSAIYGSVPPWSTRGETSLRERPWESKGENLTRLNTHALIIPAAGDEYSVYYFPYNHLWEISYCEFADAHDGVYTGDVDGLNFHHNYLHNFQDDGVYLSSFRKLYYPQHGPRKFYQNVISGCIMSFAFGGDAKPSTDVHIFRNILDASAVVADHGSPPWDGIRWYHNTILANPKNLFSVRHSQPGQTWQVFNNLVLLGKATSGTPQEGAEWGGNFAGDPNFAKPGNFQLPNDCPAIDAGVPLPNDWFDPLRKSEDGKPEDGKPDAGAIPAGSKGLQIGRNGRLSF